MTSTAAAHARPAATARRYGNALRRHWIFTASVAAYILWFGFVSDVIYANYTEPSYDLSIFDQGIWLLSKFKDPFSTLMGRDLLGDHTSFIIVPLVPLYWLWANARVLLYAQTLALAASAIPVYLLALKKLGSVRCAAGIAGALLLSPALQGSNLEAWHPEAFLGLALTLAIYAAVERRPALLWISVIAALAVKEDAALLVAPLGLWVAWRYQRRTGLAVTAVAVGYYLLAFYVIIPALAGFSSIYVGMLLPYGGPTGVIRAAVEHPKTFISYLTGGGRPFYLFQAGFSYGWMFLLAPEVAAVAAVSAAENVISDFPPLHLIGFHYSIALTAVLAAATVMAVAKLASPTARRRAVGVVVGCAAISCTLWGQAPWSTTPKGGVTYLKTPAATPAEITAAAHHVPAGAAVCSYWAYTSHIDHRVAVYQWPNPFFEQFWGQADRFTPGAPLPRLAASVQYVMLPTALHAYPWAWKAIESQFRVVYRNPDVSVYRRVRPGT